MYSPNPDQVLGWLLHQQKSDEIEEVTDEMLDEILEEREHVAVLVCKCALLISEYSISVQNISIAFVHRQQGRIRVLQAGVLSGEDRRRPGQERRDAGQAGGGQPRQRHGQAADRGDPRHRLLRQQVPHNF